MKTEKEFEETEKAIFYMLRSKCGTIPSIIF